MPLMVIIQLRLFDLLVVVGVGLFKILTVISAPIALVKSLISVIHLIAASVNIASIDAADKDKDT